MLKRMHIRDLAIVSSLEVEFQPGMTVLTGETGAGKSILIDALGLVLGDRADNNMIRADAGRAEITAMFTLQGLPEACRWLAEHALDDGDDCILRRVLVREGSSRAFINGSPIPLKSLQALGEMLVDIHGQHAHQSLLRRDHQRDLLDGYAGHGNLRDLTADLFHRWQRTGQRLTELRKASADRADRLELLAFQVDELGALELQPDEPEELNQQQRRLSSALRLQQQCGLILQLLYEDEGSAQARLSQASGELDEMLEIDPALSDSRELLENAAIQVQEVVSSLRQYADNIEINPQRLQQIDDRLGQLHDLARKYRCKPRELAQRLRDLQQELSELRDADIQLASLEAEAGELESSYRQQAALLRKSRQRAAAKLAAETSDGMRKLGMPDGRIEVELAALAEGRFSASGLDQVEFQVSANPGQPLQPLARVASGGELSRISLAVQVATLACASVPTLIFDEVDVGIGGGVAEIVGRLLRRLGEQRQVLCVTHLPQVAAQGHQHLLISKKSSGDKVATSIHALSGESRVKEIARMLGGIDITSSSLTHAREMIALSQS